jgi:hypothetical protein
MDSHTLNGTSETISLVRDACLRTIYNQLS